MFNICTNLIKIETLNTDVTYVLKMHTVTWNHLLYLNQAMRGYEEMNAYRDMLEKARADEYHVDAVLWKFCDLDVHPTDR